MSKLIILRGNSGSGKTTVAKALQEKLGYNTMRISQDEVRRNMLWVKDGKDTKALPLMAELCIRRGIVRYLNWQTNYMNQIYTHIILTYHLKRHYDVIV